MSKVQFVDFVFMRPPGGEPIKIVLDHSDPEQISRLMVAGWSQHIPADEATEKKEPE
jgi:hypothetical protein